ncbi:TPA: hypothetical protein L7T55_005579 [Klebsiella pneumoniae]|nr:hypothetical protein [Klebsiella pneumoniae]HDU2958479.1 hypothetical protein [Klebsiella pneumoniae subsp. pneumoniae]EKX6217532.1 hypothetical protein [Klebsiella pneumoniae]EKX6640599.1 hypothetical protein [Klebsiella pneumoniae]EKZ5507229.1 hypothetical protein [Klebsiella pneumoniae]ELA2005117.1 hypothetical protein [Klebsiella pneumoniae]
MHSAEIHTIQPGEVLFPAFFSSENGERGRNLLRGREALPAQPENRFSAPSGIGFVDGRLTTRFTGDSNRELNQESP